MCSTEAVPDLKMYSGQDAHLIIKDSIQKE